MGNGQDGLRQTSAEESGGVRCLQRELAVPLRASALGGREATTCRVSRAVPAGRRPGSDWQRGGDVGIARQAQQTDRDVPQRGHDAWARMATDLLAIFVRGPIPHGVGAVLDGPVPAVERQQLSGSGLLGRQAGEARDHLGLVGAGRESAERPADSTDTPHRRSARWRSGGSASPGDHGRYRSPCAQGEQSSGPRVAIASRRVG